MKRQPAHLRLLLLPEFASSPSEMTNVCTPPGWHGSCVKSNFPMLGLCLSVFVKTPYERLFATALRQYQTRQHSYPSEPPASNNHIVSRLHGWCLLDNSQWMIQYSMFQAIFICLFTMPDSIINMPGVDLPQPQNR